MSASLPNANVKIYVWYSAPHKDPPRSKPEFFGAHIGLEVKYAGKTAYLGWWPDFYTVIRSKGGFPNFKLLRFLKFYKGRLSQYPNIDAARGVVSPNYIDSVLVRNKKIVRWRKINKKNLKEQEQRETYDCTVPDAKSVVDYINKLDPKKMKYHTIFRNCATLCAQALKAGGVNICTIRIWSPRFFWSFLQKSSKAGGACKKSEE